MTTGTDIVNCTISRGRAKLCEPAGWNFKWISPEITTAGKSMGREDSSKLLDKRPAPVSIDMALDLPGLDTWEWMLLRTKGVCSGACNRLDKVLLFRLRNQPALLATVAIDLWDFRDWPDNLEFLDSLDSLIWCPFSGICIFVDVLVPFRRP
jgi:hypothetical protein